MKLKRHFFSSDDLKDLARFKQELEEYGIPQPQIHVLTLDDTEAANHHQLHEVTSLMKTDIVNSTLLGAVAGIIAAGLIILVSYLFGWTESGAGWLPFIFLAIIALGFFTWEGGLRGIESPNTHFRNFEQVLKSGRHLFFVDLEPGAGKAIRRKVKRHPRIRAEGVGTGAPHWLVTWQHRLKRFFTETFP